MTDILKPAVDLEKGDVLVLPFNRVATIKWVLVGRVYVTIKTEYPGTSRFFVSEREVLVEGPPDPSPHCDHGLHWDAYCWACEQEGRVRCEEHDDSDLMLARDEYREDQYR